MRFLKYLLLFLMILIIGGAMYVATLESGYAIKVSKIMNVPAEVVFEELNDFKSWKHWNPMVKVETENTNLYSEKKTGVGAELAITYNDKDYSVKTTEVVPKQSIKQQIVFGSEMAADGYFDIKETENGTEITWGMEGKNNFQQKIYWLLKGGIEENMLPNYTNGLALLENYLTKKMEEHSFEVKGLVDYGGGFYLYKTTSCRIDRLEEIIPKYFNQVSEYMKKNTIESFGHPFVIYHKLDKANNAALISACYPINERVITEGDVLTGFMDPVKTFKTIVNGDHKYIHEGWDFAYKSIPEKNVIPMGNGTPFVVYKLSKNNTLNPALWVSEIYIPVQETQIIPVNSF